MGKIAFVLSGQGAQHPGMGKSFYDAFSSVRVLFDEAEKYRPGTLEQCFSGTEEELKRTENTQPCLYLADLAAAIALTECGVKPEAAAGFSLGEIPALAYAGAFSYSDGFRIACIRGCEMSKTEPAAMAAVLKLADSVVVDEILVNLISNAVKYTPDGGTVTVKAAELPILNNLEFLFMY